MWFPSEIPRHERPTSTQHKTPPLRQEEHANAQLNAYIKRYGERAELEKPPRQRTRHQRRLDRHKQEKRTRAAANSTIAAATHKAKEVKQQQTKQRQLDARKQQRVAVWHGQQ